MSRKAAAHSMSDRLPIALRLALFQTRRRLWAERLVRVFPRVLAVLWSSLGLAGLACLWWGASAAERGAPGAWLLAAGACALAALAGCGGWAAWCLRGRVGLEAAAARLDRSLDLADRVASALEFSRLRRWPLGSLHDAAIADAERQLLAQPWAAAVRLRAGAGWVWLALPLALFGLGWLLVKVPQVGPSVPSAELPGVDAERPAELLPAEELALLRQQARRATGSPLGQLLDDIARRKRTAQDVFKRLAQMKRQRAERTRAEQAPRDQLARALARSKASRALGAALGAGDWDQVERVSRGLAERVRGREARPAERRRLARALREGAEQSRQAPLPSELEQFVQAMERAAAELEKRPQTAATALEQAANVASSRAESAQAERRQARLAEALEESLRQQSQASSDHAQRFRAFARAARGSAGARSASRGKSSDRSGSADGSERSAAARAAGASAADSPSGEAHGQGSGAGAPSKSSRVDLQAARAAQLVAPESGQGATHVREVSGDVVRSAAQQGFSEAPYRPVYREYHRVAERTLAAERVPQGYDRLVRRYFQLIQPRSAFRSSEEPAAEAGDR